LYILLHHYFESHCTPSQIAIMQALNPRLPLQTNHSITNYPANHRPADRSRSCFVAKPDLKPNASSLSMTKFYGVNPSQTIGERMYFGPKGAVHSVTDHHRGPSSSLYQRRHSVHGSGTGNISTSGTMPLGAVSLRVEVVNDSRPVLGAQLSGGFPSANNGNRAAPLSSATSFTTNNEDHLLLSSASASASASLSGYGIGSRSQSHSEPMHNAMALDSDSNSESKSRHKKRKRSLLRTVKDLVTKRRSKGEDEPTPTLNDGVDEDGDSMIDAAGPSNDSEPNGTDHQQTESLNAPETVTPINGNTPRIDRTTPRMSATERIEEMMGTDSLENEFILEMFREQSQYPSNSKQWFNPKAPYNLAVSPLNGRSSRRAAVDWLCSAGVGMELRRSTIYRAVFYFDALCSTKSVHLAHLRVVAASCLLVSAKWNEKEERVPTLRRFSRALNREYGVNALRAMELKILSLLDFQLKVVLPIDFVRFHIEKGCVWSNDSLHGHSQSQLHLNEHTDSYLLKFSKFFLDIAVQSYQFHQYPASIMAAAVLIASRRALKIVPYFNDKLPALCRHTPDAVRPCFGALWKQYLLKFPEDAAKAQALQPQLF